MFTFKEWRCNWRECLKKTADHKKHGISLTHKKHETKDSAAKDPRVPLAGKLTFKQGGQKFYRREV